MSEENVPKLRLKPKLAVEPVTLLPPETPVVPAPDLQPPATPDEPKPVRLKPKLAVAPTPLPGAEQPPALFDHSPSSPSVPAPAITSSGFPPPPASEVLRDPTAESPKPEVKFSLKPKGGSAIFPPPSVSSAEAPVHNLIPSPGRVQPPAAPTILIGEAARAETSAPFPPPGSNRLPAPAAVAKPAPPWARSEAAPKKKKFGLIAGGVVFVALVLGGGFFGYQKFAAKAPVQLRPLKPVAAPVPQETVAPTPVDKVAPNSTAANSNVTPSATDASNEPVQAKTVVPAETTPVEIAPPPPPPPPPPASAAFRAWVDGLRVGGVRGGAVTRVFIGGTAYATGEVVNAQLGIIFDSYNSETRHIIFKDKTGAVVERRN